MRLVRCCLLLLGVLGPTAIAGAQAFTFPGPSLSIPGLQSPLTAAAPAAASLTAGSASTASRAVVMFNNQPLFQVYGMNDRSAQDRADLASLRLADALKALSAAGSPEAPQATVDTNKTDTVLRLGGQPLLTVTDADTDNYHAEPLQLANQWAAQIDKGFAQALRERAPGYLHRAAIKAGIIGASALLLHLLLWYVAVKWNSKPGWPVQFLLWVIVVRWVLYLFPHTRPFDVWLIFGPLRPVVILFDVGLLAAVLSRLWGAVLRRLFPPLPEHLSHEEWGRRTFLRCSTLASIARVTGATIIWFIAIIAALTWAGVNLSVLLTSAGLLGVGIGLAAQDSMKDLIAGINILADDRFGVGDTIQVGEYEGRVDRLDLRITQIRDLSGRLITIPNRNIVQVANLTSRWAQVDLRIGVSYYDNLRTAMDLMTATAKNLREEWPDQILADPQMLGVDAFNETNITLRMLLRTVPGDQWHVSRELRTRIKEAFDGAGIAILNALHTAPAPEISEEEREHT